MRRTFWILALPVFLMPLLMTWWLGAPIQLGGEIRFPDN